MYLFNDDYSEGAHPNILKAMVGANLDQTLGYGEDDKYTLQAKQTIKDLVKNDQVDVYFFVGGTITNITALASILRPYEAIIATDQAHIYTHETGGIEATGHKIIATPHVNGKLDLEAVEKTIIEHHDHHMVLPKVLFVSNATELGTIYTKAELIALKDLAHKYNMYVYLDGARLAVALNALANDLSYEDLVEVCDVFYIGGTKNGALFGEALVICNDELKDNFKYNIKQRGALYAKGKFLSIQFLELYKKDASGMYLADRLALHANKLADNLRQAFIGNGFQMYQDSQVNQLFVIVDNNTLQSLNKEYEGLVWGPYDEGSSIVRYTTSWATPSQVVDDFIELIGKYNKDVHHIENEMPTLTMEDAINQEVKAHVDDEQTHLQNDRDNELSLG